MTLGEKIKKIRTDKMMTQSQLAGDEISRNMLSRIESGYALPSLPTLEYLARRLGVPAGYLLADEKEDGAYIHAFVKADIKRAYDASDYRICRDICTRSDIEDDECALIAAESTFLVAIEEFEKGNLRLSSLIFDESLGWLDRTVYSTEHIISSVAAYFRYMRMISRTLSSTLIDENSIEYYGSMSNSFCRYIHALETIDSYGTASVSSYVLSGERDDPKILHVGARIDIANNDFRSAYTKLTRVLYNEYEICRPLLYLILCDAELCCKELHDFKGAYEYSNMKSDLFQKLLSE